MHIYIYIRSQNKIFYAHTFFVAPNNSSHPFELMVILAVSNTLVSFNHDATLFFSKFLLHTQKPYTTPSRQAARKIR